MCTPWGYRPLRRLCQPLRGQDPSCSTNLPTSLHFQLVLLRRGFRQAGPALRESTSFPGLTCPLRASPLFSQTPGSRLTQGCPETPGSTPGTAQCCPRPLHLQSWREQPARPQSSAPLRRAPLHPLHPKTMLQFQLKHLLLVSDRELTNSRKNC